ncbi:MAG: DUF3105 domain-containing protein [Actinomycetota bacterium]
MAGKKRKRRPGSGTRQVRTDVSTQDRQASSSVKPAPATPGGPNRLERKEEARKQRETIRKRMARRRRMRRGGVWLGVAVALAAVVFLIVQVSRTGELNDEQSSLLAAAPAAARAAGCSNVQTIQPYSPADQNQAHIGAQGGPPTPPPLSSYPSQPPASGPHNVTPLASGEYPDPPPVDQIVHSLEHGAVVIWYDPAALTSQELTDLQTFFNKTAEKEHVIVAPYDYPDQGEAGTLPEGKQMVLVAWQRMETCNNVSLPAAFEFVYHYTARSSSDYRGVAPEAGAAIG